MDTPLHALAVPDADPATLKRPAESAREIIEVIEATIHRTTQPDATRKHAHATPA